MRSIELRDIFVRYPEVVNDSNKLKAILKDLYPENVRDRNLIVIANDIGVSNQIRNKSVITDSDLYRFIKLFEDNYGISGVYSYIAIKFWAEAYGIKIPDMIKQNAMDNTQDVVQSSAATFNSIVWENNDIQVIYKGFNASVNQDKSIAVLIENLSLSNKTDKLMYVMVINMRINGEVIKESLRIELQNNVNKQIEKCYWGLPNDMSIFGIRTKEDIKSLSFEVVYSFERYFKINQAVNRSPVINVEPYFL